MGVSKGIAGGWEEFVRLISFILDDAGGFTFGDILGWGRCFGVRLWLEILLIML